MLATILRSIRGVLRLSGNNCISCYMIEIVHRVRELKFKKENHLILSGEMFVLFIILKSSNMDLIQNFWPIDDNSVTRYTFNTAISTFLPAD